MAVQRLLKSLSNIPMLDLPSFFTRPVILENIKMIKSQILEQDKMLYLSTAILLVRLVEKMSWHWLKTMLKNQVRLLVSFMRLWMKKVLGKLD